MGPSSTQLDEPHKLDRAVTEIDSLIANVEARIERHREYVRSLASDFEGSMKAIADLNTMISSLDMLKRQRARIVRWEEEPTGNR